MLFGAFAVLGLLWPLWAFIALSRIPFAAHERTRYAVALGARRRDVLRIVGLSAGISVGLGIARD